MEIDSDIEEIQQESGFEIDLGDELKPEVHLGGDSGSDPERLQPEKQAHPVLHPPEEAELTGRKLKVVERIQQEATSALQKGDVSKAVERYTEAMRIGGSTALMLATRAVLLLKLRRPCAAVRDCTAAIKINSMILKAYRVRGIAHRKLGNWQKAHRDLTQAQSLNFDAETAELQKFVAEQLKPPGQRKSATKDSTVTVVLDAPAPTKPSAPAPPVAPTPAPVSTYLPPGYVQVGGERFVAQPSPSDKEFDQGQAVIACGLMRAPHLNGKRGVVQRRDPHPTRRGRWEVELRHEAGRVEVVALKAENIMTLNKNDKAVCKAWMKEEKAHKAIVKQREAEDLQKFRENAAAEAAEAAKARAEQDEKNQQETDAKQPPLQPQAPNPTPPPAAPSARDLFNPEKRVEARLATLACQESVKSLLRKLQPKQALEILEKAARGGSGISNLNAYLAMQAKLILGIDDSDEEEDGSDDAADDPELMREETEAFPALILPSEGNQLSNDDLELVAIIKEEASDAADRSDFKTAIAKYTEAICAGGCSALLLAKRAELLLRQRRPCAAVRDCSAAIKLNPDCQKAYRVRGLARRALAQWQDAQRDLGQAQTLDFDDSLVKAQNLVAMKVNALQEGGSARLRSGDGHPPSKRSKAA